MIATKLAVGANRLVYRLTSTAAGSTVTIPNATLRADHPNNGSTLSKLIHSSGTGLLSEFHKLAHLSITCETFDQVAVESCRVELDGSNCLQLAAAQVSNNLPTTWILALVAENSLNQ
jgi:hypothetical protein